MRAQLLPMFLLSVLLVACADKPAESAPKSTNAAEKPVAPSTAPASAPAGEPKIKAHQAAFTATAAPANSWTIDGDKTEVSFTIVSKSAGPVSGTFPKGVKGYVAANGKGEVTIDLSSLVTTDKTGAGNDVRDARVVHAFFGVPLAAATSEKAAASKTALSNLEKVEAAWKKLEGVLAPGVKQAAYRISGVDGLDKLVDGKEGSLMLHGTLVLWDSLETHFMLPLKATKTGKTISASTKEAATLNLDKVLGKTTRDLVFETMLAAGCAHQAGLESAVSISIPKLHLEQK